MSVGISSRRPDAGLVAVAAYSNAVGVLPFFLMGALAPLIRSDLALSEFQLGVAAAAFSVGSTGGSAAAGALSERLGLRRVVRLGCLVGAVSLVTIAMTAQRLPALSAGLVFAGVANALIQPAANGALSRNVGPHWQGLAFGIKQASVPFAALLTGIALATLGSRLGWRELFVLAALFPLTALLAARVIPAQSRQAGGTVRRARDRDLPTRQLVVWAAAGFLAASSATGFGIFYVEGAIRAGQSEASAGAWYSAGAIAGICGRLLWGRVGDALTGAHMRLVGALMICGGLGPLLLAVADSGVLRAIGTVIAWSLGWGWPGLFTFAVVRANRNAPAAATGITQTGLFAGALAGPLTFGAVLSQWGWSVAWTACGLGMSVGGLLLLASLRGRSGRGS